ncbi:MAG: peptide ABC transporter substrate-binding protein [Anaerolineales bacterium]|jgi:peptide/nickel transport system substrate-binding protein
MKVKKRLEGQKGKRLLSNVPVSMGLSLVGLFSLLLASCSLAAGAPSSPATPSASPTPTLTPIPRPPRLLTVCIAQEPQSLYIYGGADLTTNTVLEAIYDGPIDSNSFSYQPVILQKLPSLADGDAMLSPVTVKQGDLVVDDAGLAGALAPGATVRPAGCRSSDCAVTYSGGEIQMDQMKATFHLKPGIEWSDGVALTSADSVFSFNVAKSSEAHLSPLQQDRVESTQSYVKVDNLTVEWTGLPGYFDPQYFLEFWTPLPQHQLGAIAPQDLLTAEASTRDPLGWGPYEIEDWQAGRYILLQKNPHYWRAAEGLPRFDELEFRFVGTDADSAVAALQAGECDVVDQTVPLVDRLPSLKQLQSRGQLELVASTGTDWAHVDFDVAPVFPYRYQHPAWFSDLRMRQAVALCMDRQAVVDEVLAGESVVPDSYVSPLSPVYNSEVATYPYDPQQGMKLLDAMGWRLPQAGAQTVRVAVGVAGVATGTPLRINYWAVDNPESRAVVQILAGSLAGCGIQTDVKFFDDSLLQSGSASPVFGRQFDMAQFGWISGPDPACELYLSSQIPSAANGWQGQNDTGFSNTDFDTACSQSQGSLHESDSYVQEAKNAQAVFAENLPSLPLYMEVKVAITRPGLTGMTMNPTAADDLWNIEAFDLPGQQ